MAPSGSGNGAWMEIELERDGADVRAAARGSRNERPAPHHLGLDALPDSFAIAVRTAAGRGRPLGAHLKTAKEIHRALFSEGTEHLRARLAEASSGAPLLLRLMVREPELQGIPWEALCDPASAMGFLGTSPDLLPVRGVTTQDPWQPGDVRGALRILAVAPDGGRAVTALKSALQERITAGEVEWLDPIEGAACEVRSLFQRLRREPIPHVLHFLGHGGMEDGVPVLRLADVDDEESWLPVELLAQQLKASFRGLLRLIVLEACEGAKPSAFASAAEILARAGADAVVAHLWPVRADVARLCSEQIYRTLAGSDRGKGDIAVSLNEARRAILGAFESSAEAFSPVVYLRGNDGVLFDFSARRLGAGGAVARVPGFQIAPKMPVPPAAPRPSAAPQGPVPPAVSRTVVAPQAITMLEAEPRASSPPPAPAPAPSLWRDSSPPPPRRDSAPPPPPPPPRPAAPPPRAAAPAPAEEPAPMSRTPLPLSTGENRICTVMIIDLSAASALSAKLDPDEIKEFLDTCAEKIVEQLDALDGFANRIGPHSMLGVFGARRASETDAQRAAHAALRLQAAIAKVPLPRAARAMRPAARVGISTGRVFAERTPQGVDVAGEAVSAAGRLQQAAPPGAIVIGRDTCRQIVSRFQVQPLPPVDPGVPGEPLAAYQVLGLMPFQHGMRQEDFYGVDTKLAGRDSEKRRLLDAFETVIAEHRPALITLVGAPGAGKSRLLTELFSGIALGKQRVLVTVAEGTALAATTSYGIAAALLRRRFGIQETESPEKILHLLRRGVRWQRIRAARGHTMFEDLASIDISIEFSLEEVTSDSVSKTGVVPAQDLDDALVPLAGVLDARSAGPRPSDTIRPDEEGAHAKSRITAAAATLVRFAAGDGPVVILCDDVHWADDASLDVLNELVLRLDRVPLLVVCAARPELYERRPHWGEGSAAHRRIDLGLLDRRHVEEIIRDRLRHVRDLSPDFVRLLADRAEGNALILDETMRLLVDAGVIEVRQNSKEWYVHEQRLGTLALPTTVQGLVQARLDRLDPQARSVLERAAVVGRTFWDGAVDELAQTPGGPKAADVMPDLRERQLVRSRDATTFPGERERVFAESATQEVAYEMIPARVRRPMHRRVARWLKARAPGSAEAALVAVHYDRAGDPWAAVEQYARAAAHAMSIGQNGEALRFLSRVREIYEEADDEGPHSRSARFVGWRDRVRLRLDLGDVQRRLGRLEPAAISYSQARAIIPGVDPEAPRWEARTDYRLALLHKVRGDNTRAREIVERAIGRAQKAGAVEETPSMYALLSSLLRRERRNKEAWQTALLSLRACRAIKPDDPRRAENASRALLGIGTALQHRKRFVAAERTNLQAARLADKAGEVDLLGRALNGVASCRSALGQHARARATFLQSLRAKEKAGDLHQIAIAYTNVAELEIEMRELPAALAHARRAVHTAEQIHAESDLAEMYRVVAEAELALGKVDEAINAGMRALGIAKNVGKHYLDEVVLTLARACVRAAEQAKPGTALRGLSEEGRDALRVMLEQGAMDGELKERVELSLALMGEFLS